MSAYLQSNSNVIVPSIQRPQTLLSLSKFTANQAEDIYASK
jgi:hypothetical protein